MARYVLQLEEVTAEDVARVGGKAASLGELRRIDGVRVPPGFCVTTDAFRRVFGQLPTMSEQLDRLSRLDVEDHEPIRAASAELRRTVEALALPGDLVDEVTRAMSEVGVQAPYAVRSSATAEDSPTASFAGQHSTYLNVRGAAAVLDRLVHCWASLFTERAVTYRLRNGLDLREAAMAVVVQQLVLPRAAGVLFTADPVTNNRKVTAVEATFGLGDALVSGSAAADVYKVCNGDIVAKSVAAKPLALHASPSGGTRKRPVEPARQEQPALTDPQILQLAGLGRCVEAHFGGPQDIEWCLDDNEFWIVQSRPITTLFPIPKAGEGRNRVYVSVGHQQMMTDPMKPLGISVWQLTAARPMHEAGGRLFVDVTDALASPATRTGLLDVIGRGDPLLRDALESVLARGDFVPALPDDGVLPQPPPGAQPAALDADRAIVTELIERSQASLADLRRNVRAKTGDALLGFIRDDLTELKRLLFEPQSHQAIMAGMEAAWWLNDHLDAWLGESNAADTLARSVPDDVTADMGLALLDVADVIRPHRDVVAFLRGVQEDDFLPGLDDLPGGPQARHAVEGWLDRYGMRGPGEIDITRPRWSERPSMLLPMILANIDGFEPGERARRVERGRREAREKEIDLLRRLRVQPDGERKAAETKRMIDRLRTFTGYREYPKYGMVSRYFVYRQALLDEAERLRRSGVLPEPADIFFLTFPELHDVVRTHRVDTDLIRQRKEAFASYRSLKPPRVLTSDGEAMSGSHRRDDHPADALVGLPVSAGVVEGRARVILDIADAAVEPGDILVTVHTDPSWSPLFLAVAGLVTEVGGLMTHGAVIAREYGLPAVVGVERATELIRDGQRLRIDGTTGHVQILPTA